MPLDPDKLLTLQVPDVEHTYGPRDCILYALGVGLGQDPVNEDELAFVYEKNLKVLPTFAVVQGYNAYVLRRPELGITWSHVVHGEHSVVLHKPVAPEGTVIGRSRIVDVIDKGEGRGALVYSERKIIDKPSGTLLATINQTTFCRADGGFGGSKRETPPPHALPARAPDVVVDLPTRPEMALIYRLVRRRQPAARRSRPMPAPPASRARSCTGLPPSAWRGMPCCETFAATIPPG